MDAGKTNADAAPNRYTIGGTATGIIAPVVLQNSGGDSIPITVDGSFTFDGDLGDGASYDITILSAPTIQKCELAAATGAVDGVDVTSIELTCNNRIYFAAQDGNGDVELWTSDGTEAGTARVKDINPAGSSNPSAFARIGTYWYFRSDDGTTGLELWRTDGTEAGTTLVKDIYPGGSSSPGNFIALGDQLIFIARTELEGFELHVSDGTESGTTIVKEISAGTATSITSQLYAFSGGVIFVADDGTGRELWRSDGTADGTYMIKDVNPSGDGAGRYNQPFVVGNSVYFQGNDGSSGYELFKSDGTMAGTNLVKDIAAGDRMDNVPMAQAVGRVIFSATTTAEGTEPWVSDGSASGTQILDNITAGSASSFWWPLGNVGARLIFAASDNTGYEPWVTDGTPGGTMLLKDINPGYHDQSFIATHSGKLYFSDDDGTAGQELWVTDGTTSGTMLLKDINAGSAASSPNNFADERVVISFGHLFFWTDDGTHGQELWKTDGTPAGTVMVKDINPNGDGFGGE